MYRGTRYIGTRYITGIGLARRSISVRSNLTGVGLTHGSWGVTGLPVALFYDGQLTGESLNDTVKCPRSYAWCTGSMPA